MVDGAAARVAAADGGESVKVLRSKKILSILSTSGQKCPWFCLLVDKNCPLDWFD